MFSRYFYISKYARRECRPTMHVEHLTYGCKDYSYSRPLPPSYDLHTSTRNSMPPTALQSATYAFSDTSSTYNTVNQQRLSTRDHIYESTFAPNIVKVRDDVAAKIPRVNTNTLYWNRIMCAIIETTVEFKVIVN